ncbi:MAG: hypothetical protein Kow00100_10920 [Geothermobacteraceae bacterium]
MKQFFWLHIKKAGGLSTRKLLSPHYKEVDRVKKPKNFIQSDRDEYNDILNNYRVVLGEYQFKRCLFAKKYLYPNEWDNIYSFAFSREPIDRCISMFFYLFWGGAGFMSSIKRFIDVFYSHKRAVLSTSSAFDLFLDLVCEARESESNYSPLGLHFSTHTADVWDDITDFDGNILLSRIYRLDSLVEGINHVFEMCDIQNRIDKCDVYINKNKSRTIFIPSRSQVKKIEDLFSKDFDIYENAWH